MRRKTRNTGTEKINQSVDPVVFDTDKEVAYDVTVVHMNKVETEAWVANFSNLVSDSYLYDKNIQMPLI